MDSPSNILSLALPMDSPSNIQPMEMDNQLPIIHDQAREYRCKFCDMKFTNSQALGGHQNAHKIERSVEKTSREMHKSAAAAQSSYLPGPQQNQPYYNVPQPVMHVLESNDGPHPLINNLYQARAQPTPNPNYFNQGGFVGFQPSPRMPYMPAPNPDYFNQGDFVDLQPAAPVFPGPLTLGPPEINFGRGEDFDESGLDLALRL